LTDNESQTTTFTRYLEKREFNDRCDKVDRLFYGTEGRNGLIGDVNYIKQQINIIKWVLGISVGLISPILTTLILRYIFKL